METSESPELEREEERETEAHKWQTPGAAVELLELQWNQECCSAFRSLVWGNFSCFSIHLRLLSIEAIIQGNLHILFFVNEKSQT